MGDHNYQVKYSQNGARMNAADQWVLSALRGEREKVRRLVDEGVRHYTLVVNVRGSGKSRTGSIDKVDEELSHLRTAWSLDSLQVWWRDDLNTMMNRAPSSLKIAFLRALPLDDLLAQTLLVSARAEVEGQESIRAYLSAQYDQDYDVRFEQADLERASLAALFVDVPASYAEPNSYAKNIIAESSAKMSDQQPGTRHSMGAANLLLHRAWSGNALIVGGPGQGKTTLLQYICQYHRSLQLGETELLSAANFAHPTSTGARVPFRVDLRRYARWLEAELIGGTAYDASPSSVRDGDQAETALPSLERYLSIQVTQLSGGNEISTRNMVRFLLGHSCLIALDGLDEVTPTSLREMCAKAISQMSHRLCRDAKDLSIVASTRPGIGIPKIGTPGKYGFQTLVLQDLTTSLKRRYVQLWSRETRLDEEATSELLDKLERGLTQPHIEELSGSPMQLAILLHLMRRRGHAPEQRTDLYEGYVEVFFDREGTKEAVVREHRKIVEELHDYIAWYLQANSETGDSMGSLSPAQLRELVQRFLRDRGQPESLSVESLYTSISARVMFLIHRENGYEFEVQPLREFFAARRIFETATSRGGKKNTKDHCLSALLARTYWNNVTRFFAGMLTDGEVRGLPSNLRELAGKMRLTGTPFAGELALQLLHDQVFTGLSNAVKREVVDLILEGNGAHFFSGSAFGAQAGSARFTASAGGYQAVDHLKKRLSEPVSFMEGHAVAHLLTVNSDAGELRKWWWTEQRRVSERWLTTAADFYALDPADDQEVEHVLACARLLTNESPELLVDLLVRSASQTTAESIIRFCVTELANHTIDDWIPRSSASTSVLVVAYWVSPAPFYKRVGTYRPTIHGRSAAEDVSEILASDSYASQLCSRLIAAHAESHDWSMAKTWLEAQNVLHEVTGDCWIIRESSILFPDSGLTPSASAKTPAEGSSPKQVSGWVATAKLFSDDAGWWREQEPSDVQSLAWSHWALVLISTVKASALIELLPQVDERINTLHPFRLGQLAAATRRLESVVFIRRLDIIAALRSGAARPSARLAMLLVPLVTDFSKRHLVELVSGQLATLLPLSSTIRSAAIEQSQWLSAEVPWHQARGGRIYDHGPYLAVSGTPPVGRSKEILESVEDWPGPVVDLARAQSFRKLERLDALAVIAAKNSWMTGDITPIRDDFGEPQAGSRRP
ncbi:hypothetical protein GCM10027456_40170 [Kineosporia babensis]